MKPTIRNISFYSIFFFMEGSSSNKKPMVCLKLIVPDRRIKNYLLQKQEDTTGHNLNKFLLSSLVNSENFLHRKTVFHTKQTIRESGFYWRFFCLHWLWQNKQQEKIGGDFCKGKCEHCHLQGHYLLNMFPKSVSCHSSNSWNTHGKTRLLSV